MIKIKDLKWKINKVWVIYNWNEWFLIEMSENPLKLCEKSLKMNKFTKASAFSNCNNETSYLISEMQTNSMNY